MLLYVTHKLSYFQICDTQHMNKAFTETLIRNGNIGHSVVIIMFFQQSFCFLEQKPLTFLFFGQSSK